MATYKRPGSLAVTQFMDKPGWSHFLVNEIDEQPTKQGGESLDGIKLDLTCVGGADETQVKKAFMPLLFNPSESHRDGGEFATKVHLRLADACCLLGNTAAGEEVDIDWSKARGRQIIALLKLGKANDAGERRLEIDGAHIYHVDDPEVSHVPKNNATLTLLPAGLRRAAPKAAAATKPAANGAANKVAPSATGKPAPTTQPAAAVTQQTVNLDEI